MRRHVAFINLNPDKGAAHGDDRIFDPVPVGNCGLAGGDTQDEATQRNRMRRFSSHRHSIYSLGCYEYLKDRYVFYVPVKHR